MWKEEIRGLPRAQDPIVYNQSEVGRMSVNNASGCDSDSVKR